MGRFVKGQSGNPNGRPRQRRPNVSAFDVIIDKRLTVTQNGEERELTVDEALQLQTYQAALGGSKLAVRSVLKMIEKREQALRRLAPVVQRGRPKLAVSYDSNSANEAMLLLDILCENDDWPPPNSPRPLLVTTWAAQASFSRPGRHTLDARRSESLHLFIKDYARLRRSGRNAE